MEVHKEIKLIYTEEHFHKCMGRNPKDEEVLSFWAGLLADCLAGSMIAEELVYDDIREAFDG